MAGKIEAIGVIGKKDNMKPTKRWVVRQRNGKHVKVPFMSFRMWAEDYTQAMEILEDGSKRRKNEVMQVILPENQRGEDMFKPLAAGRKVLVRGRLTHRPNVGQDKDGNTIAYPNPVIYVDSITFMDEPPLMVIKRMLGTLQADCNVINDEQVEQYMNAFKEHFKNLSRTIDQTKTVQENITQETDDPDQLDLL